MDKATREEGRNEFMRLYQQLTDVQRRSTAHLIRLFLVQQASPSPQVEAEIKAIIKAGRKGRCLPTPNLH